jgi:hypothetical protein
VAGDALDAEDPPVDAPTTVRRTRARRRSGSSTVEGSSLSATSRFASSAGEARFELQGLVLLDPAGNYPVRVHALVFGDNGIGLVGREGQEPRVLPWSSVSTHAVEPWRGGAIPRRWMSPSDAKADASVTTDDRAAVTPVSGAPGHPLPKVPAGAVIDIRSPSGTFRFLVPGVEPLGLDEHISSIAVRHRGVHAASSVTRAVRPTGHQVGSPRSRGWARWRPRLVVALVVLIAIAVTLILLQSAGVVHLPFLGGTGGTSGAGRSAAGLRGGPS